MASNTPKATKVIIQRKITIQYEMDEEAFKSWCEEYHTEAMKDALWKAFTEGKVEGDGVVDWGVEEGSGKRGTYVRVIELPEDRYEDPETVDPSDTLFGWKMEDQLVEAIEATAEKLEESK